MNGGRTWPLSSFLICFICNGVLIAFFFYADRVVGPAAATKVAFGVGGGMTLILWLLVLSFGRRAREAQRAEKAPPQPAPRALLSPEPAIQMLSALQREGRLIDFLEEDISAYDDAQIGAAVRNIHTGCKAALLDQMEIQPVFREEEGAAVTVPPGFDPGAIRLTGNVSGDPPFRGILRHRGWQAERVRLPQAAGDNRKYILAPAEVEIE